MWFFCTVTSWSCYFFVSLNYLISNFVSINLFGDFKFNFCIENQEVLIYLNFELVKMQYEYTKIDVCYCLTGSNQENIVFSHKL